MREAQKRRRFRRCWDNTQYSLSLCGSRVVWRNDRDLCSIERHVCDFLVWVKFLIDYFFFKLLFVLPAIVIYIDVKV